MKKIILAFLLFCLNHSVWARLPVVASFSIIADMTREIGGDLVEVHSLVQPNQDAHVFQPSPADVKKVASAKLLVTNGLGMEGWMGRLSRAAHFKGVQVEAAKGVKTREAGHEGHHEHDHAGHVSVVVDPHAWHDPTRVLTYIRNIENGLSSIDPSNKYEYARRASAYVTKVKEMDAWAAKRFAAVPLAKRKMLTSHDAFAYMGERYQLQVLALQGVSTESEASAKAVARLIRHVRREKVSAVFMENMTDKRLLEQLSREAKVRIGGKLYADALSGPSGVAPSYLEMFRYNVRTILKSFN